MLRPATPLAVILLAAFVLLVLSTISTPVVKGIPLATFQGVDFGVFGYCKGSKCSGAMVGYSTHGLFNNNDNNDFSLPSDTRHSLSSILIVHPIAAFLTLILLIMSLSAHLHKPSHSPRFLLALLILTLPTLLVTLLAFLVDILLFVPHVQWGGWIVLAATILICASGIVTCAMRRTLVSRKARKRLISENPDMNGSNVFGGGTARAESPPPLGREPVAPMVNGASGNDKLPQFATFDVTQQGRQSGDEHIPLTSTNTIPSNKSAISVPESTQSIGMAVADGGMDPQRPDRMPQGARRGQGRGYNGPRDEFGNPLPVSAAFGPVPPGFGRAASDPRMRNQYANGPPNGGRPNGPPLPFPGRGRGGYPPRGGFGRGGPPAGYRGPPPNGPNGGGRGMGPMGPMAAGAGAGMMAGEMTGRGRRGPPPGYNNGFNGPPQGRGSPGPYDQRNQSPGPYGGQRGFGGRPSPAPPQGPMVGRGSPAPPGSQDGYGPRGGDPSQGLQRDPSGELVGRAESPPPLLPQGGAGEVVGQAIEMDATTGSPARPPPGFNQFNQLRDSDADVQGMVGLQQDRQESPMQQGNFIRSPSSVYSMNQDYVPPRANWGGPGRNGTPPLPLGSPANLAVAHGSPVELSAEPASVVGSPRASPGHKRADSSNYYEDVDPRFAEAEPVPQSAEDLPPALTPGYGIHGRSDSPARVPLNGDGNNSYEDLHEGTRSPAASDTSHFTSVSQRGVNPNWRPPPHGMGMGPGPGMGGPPMRRQMQNSQRDMLLGGNPDFEIPGLGRGRNPMAHGRGRGPPGQIPGMGGVSNAPGRYPTGNI
ncbi:MAG: hypothetical protein M1819_006358 [Sarea resinae]|nr:MAG: hypothetical protein M1819_006358 [Sarea resinae]